MAPVVAVPTSRIAGVSRPTVAGLGKIATEGLRYGTCPQPPECQRAYERDGPSGAIGQVSLSRPPRRIANPSQPIDSARVVLNWVCFVFFSLVEPGPAAPPLQNRASQGQRLQVERQSAMWTSYAQCNPQCQVFRVSRVMKLLKTGRVAGCDWTANGRRSRRNGRRGLHYGAHKREFGSCPRSPPISPTPVCIVSRSRPSKSPASDSGRQSTGASAMIYGSAVSSRPSRRHRTTLPTPGLLRSRRLPA